MRTLLSVAALVGLALATSSCDLEGADWNDRNRYKEDFKMSYPIQPGGRLTLEGFNGSMEINSWDRNEVEVTGTKYASTEEILKSIKLDAVNTPDSVSVRAVRPSTNNEWGWNKGSGGVKFIVRVPKKIVLDRIASSNGSIRVTGIEGNSRLKTSNGSVTVATLSGDLDIGTSNGAVNLSDITGATMVRTSNGKVTGQNLRGAIEASSSNGGITIRLADPMAGKPVRLDTSNGSVDLTMEKVNNNEVLITTSNSSITARMPANLNAQVRASTSHGNVSTDFDLRGTQDKNRLDGTIGSGGPLLRMNSSNGSIRLVQTGPGGRPVTRL